MIAKIKQGPRPLKFFPGCRVRLEGVVQALLNENDACIAGQIWVPSLEQVATFAQTEKDWSEWPVYSLGRLTRTNGFVSAGTPVRLLGTVLQQNAGAIVIGDKTNAVRVHVEGETLLTTGSYAEASGFLERDPGGSVPGDVVAGDLDPGRAPGKA